MAAVQPPRKRRARQSEAEECDDDAWSLCFADERPYSDSSDDDDDDEEVRRLEAALAAAKAKKKRRRGEPSRAGGGGRSRPFARMATGEVVR